MKKSTGKLIIGTFFLLTSCAVYQPKPLINNNAQATPATIQQINIAAGRLQHPLLKAIPFDLANGLSPDEAAIFAVVRNPELKFARDKHGIANAQLLQAGLLPNPRFSYNFAGVTGGLDTGKVAGMGLSLEWEVTALITQANKVAAAKSEQLGVDLQIAWQEWQVAQAAKIAVYRLVVYEKQLALLKETKQRLTENSLRMQKALALGLVTETDYLAAVTTDNALDVRLQTIDQQKRQQQLRLNRALGLKPQEQIHLETTIDLSPNLPASTYDQLTQHLSNHRLDLLGIQQSYQNLEQQLHIAVLQQFPKISIGFTQSKNNSNYYTAGAGIAVSIPLFDQNQGAIALASATRQQLFDEYNNRVFQANADIAELLVANQSLYRQCAVTEHALPDLQHLFNAYQLAYNDGQTDALTYYTTWNHLTDKQFELLSLQLQFQEARIALEIATGNYQLPVHKPMDNQK